MFPTLILDENDRWETLLKLCAGHLDKKGLDRLISVLDGECKTVIVEREYIDKDYRDTFANFHSKRFTTPPSRCLRLHFFKDQVTASQLDNPQGLGRKNRYLGYSVIRATRPNSSSLDSRCSPRWIAMCS